MAADICSAPSGQLFIPDRDRKTRIRIDICSDVCVVPRSLAPEHRERISYELFAANFTSIPTYGWHTLTLKVGLRWDFTWRFLVTDVHLPIIRADFLANFSL